MDDNDSFDYSPEYYNNSDTNSNLTSNSKTDSKCQIDSNLSEDIFSDDHTNNENDEILPYKDESSERYKKINIVEKKEVIEIAEIDLNNLECETIEELFVALNKRSEKMGFKIQSKKDFTLS